MTSNEIRAYNAGITDVLALALKCAATLEPRLTEAPTRFNFAIEALEAIAREGAALLLPAPSPELPAQMTVPQIGGLVPKTASRAS